MLPTTIALTAALSGLPLQTAPAGPQPASAANPPAAVVPPSAPPAPVVAVSAPPAPVAPVSARTADEPAGARRHDGLYVRMALGFSGFGDTVFTKAENEDDRPLNEGSLRGMALASELAVGGTVARGFVLGGGIYSASVQAHSFELVRGEVPSELQRPDNFSVIGLMGDWYFRPESGLHAQAALGVAALTGVGPEPPRIRDRRSAVGGGLMLGVGYEWWIASEWSFGILGRVTAALLTEEDGTGARWFHAAAAGPSVLFTATYH